MKSLITKTSKRLKNRLSKSNDLPKLSLDSHEFDLPKITNVSFGTNSVVFTFDNDSKKIINYDYLPKLKNASIYQRHNYKLFPTGIFWDQLDEDLNNKQILFYKNFLSK